MKLKQISFTKLYMWVSFAKWRTFCLEVNVLRKVEQAQIPLQKYLHCVLRSSSIQGLDPRFNIYNFQVKGGAFRITSPMVTLPHYSEVIIGAMASPITRLTIVYSAVYSGADQRKYQSSASLAFVRGIHCWPENSPHNEPVTRKMLPFNDVIGVRATIKHRLFPSDRANDANNSCLCDASLNELLNKQRSCLWFEMQ